MDANMIATARASYERALHAPSFFEDFYAELFRRCPEAEPRFANTDFIRQHRLIRHGIGLLLNYPGRIEESPNILERIAERHSRRDLDVPGPMYTPFIEALLAVLGRHDPDYCDSVQAAWKETLAPGIEYMRSRH
jgi:hemoglobin-like flavoprotein